MQDTAVLKTVLPWNICVRQQIKAGHFFMSGNVFSLKQIKVFLEITHLQTNLDH